MFSEYKEGWQITDIFKIHNVGVITKRDSLTIHYNAAQVMEAINSFSSLPAEEAREKYALPPDVRDWKVTWAQSDLKESGLSENKITPILYRPFDMRFTYYTGRSRGFLGWPFEKIMRHMLVGKNIALISARSNKSNAMDHFFCTRNIIETKCGEATTQSCLFPLYLYHGGDANKAQQNLIGVLDEKGGRVPNLNSSFISELEQRLGLHFISDGRGDLKTSVGPEDFFDYMYAIFHSQKYRARYAGFMKIDFPRLPLTSDLDLFAALAGKGQKLVSLHLLEDPILNDAAHQPNYPVKGDDKVEVISYKEVGEKIAGHSDLAIKGRVYINKTQYFEGVESEIWSFHIGGYPVCQKWLKYRKNRRLSYDDKTHFQKMVVVIRKTIQLMNEIDKAIPEWPIR
jgi:predicted helicase